MTNPDYTAPIAEARQVATDPRNDMRSCRTDAELNAAILADYARMVTARTEFDAIGGAYDMQRHVDVLHARAIGQCPGCARTADLAWAHRLDCVTPYMPRHTDWTMVPGAQGSVVIVLA